MRAPLLAVLIVMCGVALAAAQPPEARSKEHYDRAVKLIDDQQFAAAYDELAAGYALVPRPPFLFNMGECQRALGNRAEARELYRRYLDAAPTGSLAATARERLAQLGPTVPVAEPTAPSPLPIPSPVIAAARVPPRAPSLEIEAAPAQSSSRKVWWIAGGAAVLAGSIAIYFATRGESDRCAPPCFDLR